jgi:hypothetical protein
VASNGSASSSPVPKTCPQRSALDRALSSHGRNPLVQAVCQPLGSVLKPGTPPSRGGAPSCRVNDAICRAFERRGELDRRSDGDTEMLCGAVPDNKKPPISGDFFSEEAL